MLVPSILRKNIENELTQICLRIRNLNKELAELTKAKNSINSALEWLEKQEKKNGNIRKKNKSRRAK